MDTVGRVIRKAREAKNFSLDKLEEETKIKKEFIRAIEKEDWGSLPSYSVTAGFVKSIAHATDAGEKRLIALFRRDYPPKSLAINPKPDVSSKFVWSPRLTFILGICSVAIVILGYLVFQYFKFVAAPSLAVFSPKDGEEITTTPMIVSGQTDTDAVVKVNNQPIILDQDGKFQSQVQIYQGTSEIVVETKSRAGKTTVVKRKIIPKLN